LIGSKRILLFALCVAPTLAHAQSEDQALAQTLFDEALKLMEKGNFASACPKLAESQRLDPGGGTVFNLAMCREKEGKLASAWSAYNESLSLSIRDGRKDRETAARDRLAGITSKLAKLTVNVPSSVVVPGLEVRLDEAPVRQAVWGVATPVDVGSHHISVTATGKLPWKTTVEIQTDGERKAVDVPALEDEPVTAAPPPPPAPRPVDAVAPKPEKKDTTLAWIAGGVGAAGLITGTIAGIVVFSKRGASDAECRGGCTQHGVDLMNEAKTAAWVSDIAFGVGLAGIGTSIVLFVLAKPAPARTHVTLIPAIGPTFLGAQGTF
jgi:hypothetical protein